MTENNEKNPLEKAQRNRFRRVVELVCKARGEEFTPLAEYKKVEDMTPEEHEALKAKIVAIDNQQTNGKYSKEQTKSMDQHKIDGALKSAYGRSKKVSAGRVG